MVEDSGGGSVGKKGRGVMDRRVRLGLDGNYSRGLQVALADQHDDKRAAGSHEQPHCQREDHDGACHARVFWINNARSHHHGIGGDVPVSEGHQRHEDDREGIALEQGRDLGITHIQE